MKKTQQRTAVYDQLLAEILKDAPATTASEITLREMVDWIPACLALITPDLHYVMVNLEFSRWYGRERNEIIGAHVEDVIGVEAFAASQASIKRALRGESVSFLRSDARATPTSVHVNIRPITRPNGEVMALCAVVTDVTQPAR